MTNKNIIYNENWKPYTYLIGWTKHNVWYYGAKYGKDANPDTFWVDYFTSSVGDKINGKHTVDSFRKNFGEPDVIQIRKTFSDGNDALLWEHRVLCKINAMDRSNWLNRSNGFLRMASTASAPAKDAVSQVSLGCVDLKDPRWKTGEIVGINSGVIRDENFKRNLREYQRNLPKSVKEDVGNKISKRLTGVPKSKEHNKKVSEKRKGKVSAAIIVATGQQISNVDCDDPRWETGEIVGNRKGKKGKPLSLEHKNKISANGKGKIISEESKQKSRATRLKNKLAGIKRKRRPEDIEYQKNSAIAKLFLTGEMLGRVSKSDPRWATGEIVGNRKTLHHLENKNV